MSEESTDDIVRKRIEEALNEPRATPRDVYESWQRTDGRWVAENLRTNLRYEGGCKLGALMRASGHSEEKITRVLNRKYGVEC